MLKWICTVPLRPYSRVYSYSQAYKIGSQHTIKYTLNLPIFANECVSFFIHNCPWVNLTLHILTIFYLSKDTLTIKYTKSGISLFVWCGQSTNIHLCILKSNGISAKRTESENRSTRYQQEKRDFSFILKGFTSYLIVRLDGQIRCCFFFFVVDSDRSLLWEKPILS